MRPRLLGRGNILNLDAYLSQATRFNEAAAVRPRKLPGWNIGSHRPSCFNEAAAVRPRKHATASLMLELPAKLQ